MGGPGPDRYGKPMSYRQFCDWFPEIARQETRAITILHGAEFALPPAQYVLLEMYCTDTGCDCRRVFLQVVSPSFTGVLCVIAYGWESDEFYAQWAHDSDPDVIGELKGPILNLVSPQSTLAPELLRMVTEVPLRDAAYVERLKRHYRIFQQRVAAPAKRSGRKAKR